MKEKKNKNANELIPELIIKINNYSSKLRDRVKIDSIFREFDSYAHSNFQNFIKMSEQRYKSVKSGNSLNSVLSKQKKEANNLSSKILSNNLYIDNEIEKENKKLFKKINKKENKELYQIRHNIIEKTKNYTAKELRRRKKYASAGERNFSRDSEQYKKSMSKGKLDWMYKSKFFKNTIKAIKNNGIKDFNKISKTTEDKEREEYLAKKQFVDNLVFKDNENINNNITDYKEFLKDIEKIKDDDISRLINSGNNFGHQYSFKIKDIKLLSYKEEKKEDVKTNKKDNPEIDIVKLIRYTKRGNKKWFKKNLKIRSQNRLNSFKNKFGKKKTASASSSAINIGRNQYLNKIIDDNDKQNSENNDINMMGLTSSTGFSNFKNTIKTVKNEAEMVLIMNQNFDKKRNTMEGFFKRNTLPKLEEYETMFKTRNNFRNMNKSNKANLNNDNVINNIKNNLNLKNNMNSTGKHNLKDQLINKDVFEDFQKTYFNKKIKWAEEDIQKEKIKKKEQELIEETKKYLREIKQVKRKVHLYVDAYSKRDDLINNRIKLFARSLSGPFYSQKKLQSKLDDFNNYIELKEYEKKKNDEKLSKTMKEEDKKRKEQAEEYKLMAKIRKNLKNENTGNDEVGDIKLNYKFISSLKMCKKEDKDQPYKDYKEIYEIIKDKKRNGEYDVYGMKNEEKKIK